MKKMLGLQVIGAAMLIWAAGTAGAVVVNYNEAVNGELPGNDPIPVLAFDIGTNTVAGTLAVGNHDSFAFTVPAGAELLAAQVQLTDNVGNFAFAEVWEFRSGTDAFGGPLLEASSTPPSRARLCFRRPPLGSGDYNLSNLALSGEFGVRSPGTHLHTAPDCRRARARHSGAPRPRPRRSRLRSPTQAELSNTSRSRTPPAWRGSCFWTYELMA